MAKRIKATVCCSDCITEGFTVILSEEKEVYFYGKLRTSNISIYPKVPKLSSLINIQSIAVSYTHVLCLDYNGNLFGFGSNQYGQLGLGADCKRVFTPKQIAFDSSIEQISCGSYFSVVLTENNELFSFGYNHEGQLGIGSSEQCFYTPQKIDIPKDIDFVECGSKHTICKTKNNEMYGWGYNRTGELGINNQVKQIEPCLNTYWPSSEIILDIKCSNEYTLILTLNQEVYSCGSNEYSQLGRETKTSKYAVYNCSNIFKKINDLSEIIRIECGDNHSMCIDVNNDLFIFGDNRKGQLGIDVYPIGKPMKLPISNIIDISKGGSHTFVKTSNKEIYAFGSCYFSQLGFKTKESSTRKPIQVFKDNEDIWYSNIFKSKVKSAKSILPRPKEYDSPPLKKQKISE